MKDEIKKALEGGTPGRWYWMKTIESNAHKWLQWQLDRIEQLEKALEWSAMIIGSGLDSDAQLQYDPMKWIQTYHSEWKEDE